MKLSDIVQHIMLTAEACGGVISREAAQIMAVDLAPYGATAVMDSLTRCRREVKGRLGLKDIIERIDDGRPGPDESWAMVLEAQDEQNTVVWCAEMRDAYSVAAPLLEAGDKVAARMAYKECYERLVGASRAERRAAQWEVSAGWDAELRKKAIFQAVERGLIPAERANLLLPAPPVTALLTGPAVSEETAKENLAKIAAIVDGAMRAGSDRREEEAEERRVRDEARRQAAIEALKKAGDSK